MKLSQYYIPTLKEAPKDADIISAKLMLRAGLIRKTASGIYEWLPLGIRILKKVENIIREELDAAGCCEVWLPIVQPQELWEKSTRWTYYGKELLRFKDRKGAGFCLAPTAEEVMTNLVMKDVNSYKQLPLCLYQFGTKFRDEIRPRFGVMRAREFYMKDAYSFCADEKSAAEWYQRLYDAYMRIFTRFGFKFKPVEADTGNIGGNFSHEFMVLAQTGENEISVCPKCGYTANTEKTEIEAPAPANPKPEDLLASEEVSTPEARTIDEVAAFLKQPAEKFIKMLVYKADGKAVVVLMRGNDELNEIKLKKLLNASELEKAEPDFYEQTTGSPLGFAGPCGLKQKNADIKIYADNHIKTIVNGIAGANKQDTHLKNVNLGRDFQPDVFADLKLASKGDRCPRCSAEFEFMRGIEVGHTFKLGTKYSLSMGANFLDENQQSKPMIMGCYGIGVSRVIAAAIEQSHDENGIIWPAPLSPFDVELIALDTQGEVKQKADEIYNALRAEGITVLYDERDERPGVKFKDADLIGIPHRIVIGKKLLPEGKLEYKARTAQKAEFWPIEGIEARIKTLIGK
ncbi:proline--tRNA ligase [Candidatus Proelusimicrobium volucris]|uniref:proline--tRNA ligase n=1 Tax=Candidatus Proelusimicrobium volucris TaxID=3416225 RepID=UPI003D0BEF64